MRLRVVRLFPKILVLSALAIVASCLLNRDDSAEGDPQRQLTVGAIRYIHLGMKPEEVRGILGDPIDVETPLYYGNRIMTFRYTEPQPEKYSHLMLWVTFESARVIAVAVKRKYFWGTFEEVVYLLSSDVTIEKPAFASLFPP